MRIVAGIVGSIDRTAFWLAVAAAIAGWAAINRRPVPVLLQPGYGRRMRRGFFVCAAATGALAVTVTCDGVLTILRLSGPASSAAWLIPILSMSIEIAGAGILAFHLRRVARQSASLA